MKNIHRLLLLPIFLLAAFIYPASSFALPPGFFAENSVLAEGKWVRIESSSTGMQLIPAASLRAMGFSDIKKVNVYGGGGRMLPEALNAQITDDLPLLPCIRTDKGIIFFSTDINSWNSASDVPYSHTINPYDTKSYYFLSDRSVAQEKEMPRVAAPHPDAPAMKSFVERLVHESELAGPGESGRTLFGEDFRTTRTRSFPFTLTGSVSDYATVKVRFGAKSSTQSSLLISANGNRLPSTTDDNIRAITGTSEIIRVANTVKNVKNPGASINVGVEYSSTGQVQFARLDYIEVFYDRELKLQNGSLYFYNADPDEEAAAIDGCSSSTRIWDVTDPANPKEMGFNLSGSVATISLSGDYQEFIAFDPQKISSPAPAWKAIPNQNLHALETPDMVIITYDTYMEGAKRIAALHEQHDGMKVHVLRPEDIYNEFSDGSADVTAFRKLLKMWHDRGGERTLRFCLLMGRPHYDNRVLTTEAKALGYRPMPIWEEPNVFTDAGSYSTDCYIAMLDDCNVGFNMSSAKMQVAVGRIPCKTAQEANDVAAKIERYVLQPDYGAWRNKMLLVADDIDDSSMADVSPAGMTTFFDQSQSIYNILKGSSEGKKYLFERIYLDAHKLESTSLGLRYPSAKGRLLSNFSDGVAFANYLGHASETGWAVERLLTMDDIDAMNNRNLPFLFGGTCEFAHWDGGTVTGGELMVLNPVGGVIAMVMPSRTVYITQNYYLNRAMAPYLFKKNELGERARLGDFYRRGMNDLTDSNKLRYCLIGDPAITFPLPVNVVEFESIDGVDITDKNMEIPEIPALGKAEIKGRIVKADGELDEEFNGSVELILFDAEKVIDTSSLGKGLTRMYNDRSTRLTTTSVKVENGLWSARLMLPAEIENNYSPAMITAYAWNSKTGEEAHGTTESLYVYGYDEDAPADTKAPEIETFYLNSASFQNGAVVNNNPIVFATFSDESGINVSDAGIGHQMILTLDGKKYYTDVNSYFISDPEREGAGSICYPLENIEPGKHTLTLTIWDNANNSASASLEFNVGAALDPIITDLSTNVNPASTSVVFNVTIDRPNSNVECLIEVFDLLGRTVWQSNRNATTDMQSSLNAQWDLRDGSGVRVPRGIYLYRATVRTPEGTYSSQSRKLAVTAQ